MESSSSSPFSPVYDFFLFVPLIDFVGYPNKSKMGLFPSESLIKIRRNEARNVKAESFLRASLYFNFDSHDLEILLCNVRWAILCKGEEGKHNSNSLGPHLNTASGGFAFIALRHFLY